jgi:aspartate 1-decarboxylase
MISVNGSAARRASVGDLLIIASFAQVHEDQVAKHEPQLVFVDEHNQQVGLRHRRLRLGMVRMSVELTSALR